MKTVLAMLAGKTHWTVERGAPSLMELPCLPGWSIWNPLIPRAGRDPEFIKTRDDSCFVITGTLSFRVPDDKDAFGAIERLISHVRIVRRQPSFPAELYGITSDPDQDPPDLVFPAGATRRGMKFRKYYLQTAVPFNWLRTLTEADLASGPSLVEELLIDAIHALEQSDFKKSILYAAIASEAVSSSSLASAYHELLLSRDVRIRAIELPQAGGSKVIKDPIYEKLESSESFSMRLHELPLYVLCRSMLVEDQELYRKGLRLYKTRNKLAHGDELPTDDTVFQLSAEGASEAMSTALSINSWFGGPGGFVLPSSEFDELPPLE